MISRSDFVQYILQVSKFDV